MEGALLFHDDVPGQQAPGLVNEHLDAEGPLPPDVILGHPYPYTAPNQAAFTPQNHASLPEPVQDDVAFGEVNPPLVPQPALAQENMLGLIFGAAPGGDGADGPDLGFAQPQPDAPVPNLLPTALVVMTHVIHYLQHNHPELAVLPDGPGLVSALHTALTNYMLAHGLLTDALGAPQALQEDLPPLDGLEDLVGLPGDEQEVFIPLPDAQEGIAGALAEELFEANDVLVPPQNGLDHLEVAQEQHGAPPEPVTLLGAIPDVGPVQVIGEPGPAMEPGPVVEFNAVPPEGVVVNYENEVPDAVGNLGDEENAPPPYGPADELEPEEFNDEVEPEHDEIAVVDHRVEEAVPPEAVQEIEDAVESVETHSNATSDDAAVPVLATMITGASVPRTSDILVRLDEEGQTALSLLCAQFDITDDPENLKRVLVEAVHRMSDIQTARVKPLSRHSLLHSRESPTTAAKRDKPNRMLKLRDAWKKAFTGKPAKSPSRKQPLEHPVWELMV